MVDAGHRFIHSHLLLTALSMRRLQQQRGNPGQFKVIKWICKPKIHYFDHQLLLTQKRRVNTRHTHTVLQMKIVCDG